MTNITEHKWSDPDVKGVSVGGGSIYIYPDYGDGLNVNKSDAIAIAKHFNLKYSDIFESSNTLELQEINETSDVGTNDRAFSDLTKLHKDGRISDEELIGALSSLKSIAGEPLTDKERSQLASNNQ